MSSNIIGPLPKEYNNPSETVRKTSAELDDTKKGIGLYYWHICKIREYIHGRKNGKNIMWWRKTSLHLFQKNKIDTINKIYEPQASNKTIDTTRSDKIDKVKSIDISRSTQIIDK